MESTQSPRPAFVPQAQAPAPRLQKSSLHDFLAFRTMVTPIAIQTVFWIGAILSFFSGLRFLGHSPLIGLGFMVAGPLIVRIYCELIIVGFRAYDSLKEIAENTRR